MSLTSTASNLHRSQRVIAAATVAEIAVAVVDVQAVVEADGIAGVVMAAEVVAVGTGAVAAGTKAFFGNQSRDTVAAFSI